MVVGNCFPCSKLVADDVSCFEPEAGGYLVEGLPFHKFYFSSYGGPFCQSLDNRHVISPLQMLQSLM